MQLALLDWLFVLGFFALSLTIGAYVSRRAGRDTSEFFLSGRSLPWWMLGLSMVATTFAADTPNLVTQFVRENGVAGNWAWWAFLVTGMLTVFVYARLWRRSGVMTDIEFYELRYGGRPAAFLRGFRALWLGVVCNALIMAVVSLAAIKLSGVLLGLSPIQTILGAGVITVVYSMLGGLRGVILTDAIQFAMAITGAILAAKFALGHPDVGGLGELLRHPAVADKLAFFPDPANPDVFVPVFLIPIAVQWWSAWYPGAEPGGGGYIAQRMLAAKSESDAVAATLLFNVAHYALRPWPWILVALASLVVYPDVEALRTAFPDIDPQHVRDDLAYPAMLTILPAGALGLVVASLAAAYMSTMSTHLNWGASYVALDWYRRFVDPSASERTLVRIGRVTTLVLMVLASAIALGMESAVDGFQILLQVGAGTGLVYLLRWFWWRVNAWSEVSAMVVSFAVAIVLRLDPFGLDLGLASWQELLIGVGVTTAAWLIVTAFSRPVDGERLRVFYRTVRPGGRGWRRVIDDAEAAGDPIEVRARSGELPLGILASLFGCVGVWSAIFATGSWIYGRYLLAIGLTVATVVAIAAVARVWPTLLASTTSHDDPPSHAGQ